MVKKPLEDLDTEIDGDEATEVADSKEASESQTFFQKLKKGYADLDQKIRDLTEGKKDKQKEDDETEAEVEVKVKPRPKPQSVEKGEVERDDTELDVEKEIINEKREALSESSSGADKDEEEDDDEDRRDRNLLDDLKDQFLELVQKIKGKKESDKGDKTEVVSKLKESGDSEDDEDDEEESESEEGLQSLLKDPEKRGKIIQMVAVLVAVWFFLTEFIFVKEPPPKQPQVTKKSKSRKPKRKVRKKAPEKKVAEVTKTKPKKKPKAIPKPKPKPKPEPKPKAVVTKPEPKVVKKVVAIPKPEPTPLPTPEKVVEKIVAKVPEVGVKKQQKKNVSQQLETMMKIVEKNKPEEVIPDAEPLMPDYEQVGRGLVYNCEGGYWACLDKTNYFRCRDNMTWRKSNRKNVSCYVSNVYASEEDCYKVQLYNINSIEDTSFCKNK